MPKHMVSFPLFYATLSKKWSKDHLPSMVYQMIKEESSAGLYLVIFHYFLGRTLNLEIYLYI